MGGVPWWPALMLLALVTLLQLPHELLRDRVWSSWGLDTPSVEKMLNRLNGDLFWPRVRWLPVRSEAGMAASLRSSACCGGRAEEGLREG